MSLPDQGKSIKSSRRWEIISPLLAFFASPKQRVQPLVGVYGERRLASPSKPLLQVVSDTGKAKQKTSCPTKTSATLAKKMRALSVL